MGSRVHAYEATPYHMVRAHTQGVLSWDAHAGASVRRRKHPVPLEKHATPGSSLDVKRKAAAKEEKLREAKLGLLREQTESKEAPNTAPKKLAGEITSILRGDSTTAAAATPAGNLFLAHPDLMRLRTPARQVLKQGARVAAGGASVGEQRRADWGMD